MSAHPPEGLSGSGTHTIAIGDRNGQVVLRFERPVEWVSLDAETARNVAEQIARSSYKAKFGDTPTTERRSAISDQKVATLRIRLRNILKGELPGADEAKYAITANAMLDAVLTEIA